MKDTGNKMDCVACGKPISITAKFCGKCGAPVKRDEPSPVDEASAAPQALEPTPHQTEEVTFQNESIQNQSTEPLDELVLTIEVFRKHIWLFPNNFSYS